MKIFLKILKYAYKFIPPITLGVVAYLYYFDQNYLYIQIGVVAAILTFWASGLWTIMQKILGK